MAPAAAVSAASRPSVEVTSPPSSARSTSKRATGTARSSSRWIASAPSDCTTSAGSRPAGSRTIRKSTGVVRRRERSSLWRSSSSRPRRTASCPAVSGSWHSSTRGASLARTSTCGAVSAVPIEHTASGTPAWRSAITSV